MAMIRHPKDFYSGLLFIGFGVFALIVGSNYTLGSAARMGPGYFPRILGILLVLIGALLVLRSLRLRGAAIPPFRWKPMLIVFVSVLIFGFIIDRLGLALSTVFLIFAASSASHEFRWKEALVSGVLFAALAIAVFIIGLKLQLPIWPPIFQPG